MGEEEEEVVISIPNEDGVAHDSTLISIFTTERGREYAALLSHVPDEDGSYPLEVFRCTVNEGEKEDEIVLENIPSDMEYDEARAELERLLNAEAEG